MVDHSTCWVAVYDLDKSIRSGTGMTYNYAVLKKKLPVEVFIQIQAPLSDEGNKNKIVINFIEMPSDPASQDVLYNRVTQKEV